MSKTEPSEDEVDRRVDDMLHRHALAVVKGSRSTLRDEIIAALTPPSPPSDYVALEVLVADREAAKRFWDCEGTGWSMPEAWPEAFARHRQEALATQREEYEARIEQIESLHLIGEGRWTLAEAKLAWAEELISAAYQIVGCLADRANLLNHPSVTRALDAFADYKEDPDKPLLPFPHIPFED